MDSGNSSLETEVTKAIVCSLTVQDVGVGLEPHVRDKLFQAFSPPRAVEWASDCPSAVPIIENLVVVCGANRMTGPAPRLPFPFPAIQHARRTRDAL